MQRSRFGYGFLLLLPLLLGSAHIDHFTGSFTGSLDGEVYHLSISGYAGGQYEGEFQAGGETMPLNARRYGDSIAGQIGIAGFKFGFMAQVQGAGLILHNENGNSILFERDSDGTQPVSAN